MIIYMSIFQLAARAVKGLGRDFLWLTQWASISQELHWQTITPPSRLHFLYRGPL